MDMHINLHLDNDAMQSPDGVAWVLRQAADWVRDMAPASYGDDPKLLPFHSHTLLDLNGNDVGRIVCKRS